MFLKFIQIFMILILVLTAWLEIWAWHFCECCTQALQPAVVSKELDYQ